MSVYKRTDKKGWYFSFYFNGTKIKIMNWKKINGINKIFDSKVEASTAEAKYRLKLENPIATITLYDLYDEYVSNTKGTLKETTLRKYDVFKRNYLSLIKNKLVSSLDIKDIVKWRSSVLLLGITADTKNNISNIMLQLLKYGSQMYDIKGKLQLPLLEPIKENKVIEYSNKSKFIPPNAFEKLIQPLKDYIDLYNNRYYYTILYVLYNTGVRIGELAALTINDIFDNYILINKDYARINEKDLIQATKNKNSIRKVYLDGKTKEILQEYINTKQPTNILFNLEKEYINQQRLRLKLKELGKITHLDEIYELKIHNLRHSHASNLRQLGYDEKLISQRLGNTPEVAIQTYIHTTESEQQEIALKIENLKK